MLDIDRLKNFFKNKKLDDAGTEALPQSEPRPLDAVRSGIYFLVIAFGGFLLWASFAPLDEGVPSEGIVSIETKRKAVQHISGGVVEKVFGL